MNAGRPGGAPKGCAGAMWYSGRPSEDYCKGGDGKYPWWARCCMWDDGANKCQKKYYCANAPASMSTRASSFSPR